MKDRKKDREKIWGKNRTDVQKGEREKWGQNTREKWSEPDLMEDMEVKKKQRDKYVVGKGERRHGEKKERKICGRKRKEKRKGKWRRGKCEKERREKKICGGKKKGKMRGKDVGEDVDRGKAREGEMRGKKDVRLKWRQKDAKERWK